VAVGRLPSMRRQSPRPSLRPARHARALADNSNDRRRELGWRFGQLAVPILHGGVGQDAEPHRAVTARPSLLAPVLPVALAEEPDRDAKLA